MNVGPAVGAPTHGISRCASYWCEHIKDHPDPVFASKIMKYVTEGIPIDYEGVCIQSEIKNWPSAGNFSTEVDKFVRKHSIEGAIEGPCELGIEVVKTSPIGAFMKKGKSKARIIHDLSYPKNESINDGIDKENSSVMYASVLDAVRLCKLYAKPYMAKYDLEDAYLSCPVREEDRKFLGFLWKNGEKEQIMRFSSLPFGLRSSAKKFSEIAQGLMYIAQKNGAERSSLFYLDDSITVCSSYEACKKSIEIMCDTAKKCGFKINDKKTEGPNRVLVFLGIELNSITQQMRITEERLQEIREELQGWSVRKTCTKRELQSIVGKLQFCSKVVIHGNKFIRRLISLSKKGNSLNSKIRINKEARKDLAWWEKCMGCHNGLGWFEKNFEWNRAVMIHTDASDIALAAVMGQKWTILTFDGSYCWISKKSIGWRELLAVVVALSTFGPLLRNKSVVMHIDNAGVQQALEKGHSNNEDIMPLIRVVYFYAGIYNITYKCLHISTTLNTAADALSRLKFKDYFMNYPASEPVKTEPVDFLTDF